MNTLHITPQQRTLIEALQQRRQIVVTHNRSGKRAYSDAMIRWWKLNANF